MSIMLDRFIESMIDEDADSLFLIAGARPFFRRNTQTIDLAMDPLTAGDIEGLVDTFSSHATKRNQDGRISEIDFSLSLTSRGRFRINAYRQRGSMAVSIRRIRTNVHDINELGLPQNVQDMILDDAGLIIVAGPGSCGKSHTLASMIQHRNREREGYILTIENPIEYIFKHDRSVIAQRELQIDTETAEDAFVSAYRQSPDMAVIGEIRDELAMRHTLGFAESGNLCLATIRATNAVQAIRRMIAFFPPEQQDYALDTLAVNLRCIVAQRMLPALKGGNVAVHEVLYIHPDIREHIRTQNIRALEDTFRNPEGKYAQIFWDKVLCDRVDSSIISLETAMRYAHDSKWVGAELQRRKDFKRFSEKQMPPV
ncbi:ATPase, T2SS/T4P/T4SS family [Marinobacterium sp. BA1]|uniref:ATPase, T2SS/T4P/T4SS family n=1 Tax=Marinobacterium sp. BA1 TaxID=3138931 RepID=UPI0032E79D5B